MSLITFFNESMKYLCLFFLSMAQSFNYFNYIPFIIIFLRETKNIDLNINIFLLIYFISYEIAKYFSTGITTKFNDLIGENFYYSLSICVLSVVNLAFSFISFSFYNIYILIIHRILISLFNNIGSNIDINLSLFYPKKKIIFKRRNFAFIQKITNFLFFLLFLLFFNHLNKFYIFCFFLSVLNLVGFIFSLIIIFCHKEKIYNNYYPSLSEKENDISIIKTSQKGKLDNKNNEMIVEMSNNNSVNYNINTGVNNVDKLIKDNKNKMDSNLIYNESFKNEIKSIEISNKKKPNSSIIKGIISPPLFKGNKIQQLYHKNVKKIFIGLLIVLVLSKSLIFLSLYMLLFKVSEIKIISFVNENNNELLFSKLSSKLNLNSIEEEYIFLFMCYYFLNIFQYFVNMAYTSISFKNKIVNYIFYYLSLIIILFASLLFTFIYLQKFTNTKMSTNKIGKGVIIIFISNYTVNECITIMTVFYNILGKKKGFSEKLLKEIKTLTVFLASLIFSIIQGVIILLKIKVSDIFEKIIYYIIYCLFTLIIFFISILLLNY